MYVPPLFYTAYTVKISFDFSSTALSIFFTNLSVSFWILSSSSLISSSDTSCFASFLYASYFSTDTATVLRAIEIEAETIFLAKAIDGVYDSDPKTNPDAKKYDEVSIDEVIAKNLQVVDMTASILCRDNKMPMLVFGLNEKDSIVNTAHGIFTGTKVLV